MMNFFPLPSKSHNFFGIFASTLKIYSLLSQDNVCFIDAQVTMNTTRNSARNALAALFNSLEPHEAHWYCIIPPCSDHPSSDRVTILFPHLVSLLSIRDDIFGYVLKTCGLVRSIRNKATLSMNSLEDFQNDFKLYVEFTIFSIYGKRYSFIRVGSWGPRHSAVTPKEIWASGHYSIPKLKIATVVIVFLLRLDYFIPHSIEMTSKEKSSNLFPTMDFSSASFPWKK
jgi:hypothetical protein